MIFELLDEGQERKKTMKQLQEATGLKVRDVRAAIRAERRAGHFILTSRSAGGYWLWDGKNADEMETFAQENKAAALDLLKTIGPFIRELQQRKQGA